MPPGYMNITRICFCKSEICHTSYIERFIDLLILFLASNFFNKLERYSGSDVMDLVLDGQIWRQTHKSRYSAFKNF